MATQTIGAGQVLSGATITSDLIVTSGGRVINSTVTPSTIPPGPHALVLSSGGTATGTVLDGLAFIYSGGTATSTTVSSGGNEEILGGIDNNAVIDSGGVYSVEGGFAGGPVFHSGSRPDISTGLLGDATIEGGVIVQVFFSDAVLYEPRLQPGASIDYRFLPFTAGGSVSFDLPTGALTVSEGGTVKQIALIGIYTSKSFVVADDGALNTLTHADGTIVTEISNNPLPSGSTIGNSLPGAAQFASYARYDAYIAASPTGLGTAVVSAALNGTGDVAIYSTPDGAGHALSASGTGTSIIAAGGSADTVTVANGSDLVATGVGTNNVYLVTGANTLDSEGTDTVFVGAGSDTINVAGNAVINAGAAALSIFLSPSASLALHTGTGSVTVQGGFGSGSFSGGTNGHNLLVAGTGPTTLYAGGDGDTLIASGGSSTTLYGWGGSETMVGQYSQGFDTFNFGGANVFATGGAGQNVFNIGTGHNAVVALLGADTFNLTNGSAGGSTYIANFNTAVDRVHLSGYTPGEAANALSTATTYAGSEILTLRDGTSLTFGAVTGLTGATFA